MYFRNALKQNAKRRGKYFDLTLEEFKKFCIKHDYLAAKGRKSFSMTIDREDTTKGYTANNIQPLSNANNVKKHHRYKSGEWDGNKMVWVTTTHVENNKQNDCPF